MAQTRKSKHVILGVLKKRWLMYIGGIALAGATSFLNAQIPGLLGDIVKALTEKTESVDFVRRIALMMIGVAVAAFITRFVWRYFIIGTTRRIELNLRRDIFAHLQTLTGDTYQRFNTGDIITRSISDINAVRMMFGIGLVGIIDTVVVTGVSLSYMIEAVDWKLTLAAVIPLPLLMLLLVWLRRQIKKRFKKAQEAVSDLNAKTQENITGVRIVKAFAQESSEVGLFSRLSRRKWAADMAMVRVSALISPATAIVFGGVFAAFLIIGGKMVIEGSMDLGQYVAFNGYLALIVEPMNMISRVIQIWQRGRVSMDRLDELFELQCTVNDSSADPELAELPFDRLSVKDISFTYPGKYSPVLKNVSFELKRGETLAVMGMTGCGKSTLANLVLRLWPVENGKVFIDGSDINAIPLASYRSRVSFVPQDSFLFSDTISENIAFFDESITDGDVEKAARLAAVHENILEQPDGYNTVVGERGVTLSGGQKQRVSIARALARKPALLVLDDCLSAVDTATEHEILSNLSSGGEGRMTLFITHRISAAAAADNILLLSPDGAVAAYGPHEQLLKTSPEYNELIRIIENRRKAAEGGGLL